MLMERGRNKPGSGGFSHYSNAPMATTSSTTRRVMFHVLRDIVDVSDVKVFQEHPCEIFTS